MALVALTGEDTIMLFGRVFTGLADGDAVTVDFPNEKVAIKTGKNGNTVYVRNETGNNANVTLRVIRGSADDRFLNARKSEQDRDMASFALAAGQFVKRSGDGNGAVISEIYELEGGAFVSNIAGRDNVEGDTDAAVATYNMRFASAQRTIG